jgi:hypothetical protein
MMMGFAKKQKEVRRSRNSIPFSLYSFDAFDLLYVLLSLNLWSEMMLCCLPPTPPAHHTMSILFALLYCRKRSEQAAGRSSLSTDSTCYVDGAIRNVLSP